MPALLRFVESFDFFKKCDRLRTDSSLRFMQPNVRKCSIEPSVFVFAIRKAREPSVVSPIRRSKVATKTRRQHPSSKRRTGVSGESLRGAAMLESSPEKFQEQPLEQSRLISNAR